MSLCSTCVACLNVAHLRSTAVPFHASLAALKASSGDGCPFCRLCWTALQRNSGDADIQNQLDSPNPEQIQLYGGFEDYGDIRQLRLNSMGSHILVSCGEPADIRQYLNAVDTSVHAHLNVHASADSPARRTIRGRLCAAEPHPLDAQLSLARMWLKECRAHHESCRLRLSDFWPLRVLDVGDGKHQMPHLIVNEQLSEPYAALSYCWGDSTREKLRLLTTNLEDLQRGINVSEMARTNSEALEVVRELGIRYLWIDALCIIQDSKEDWRQQSQLMAEIYNGAYLTIVAGSAANSSDGFLHVGDPGERVGLPYSNPTVLPYSDPAAAEHIGIVYASLQPSRDEGPAKTRAWCFQERILSNRTLVWGAEQIFFKCHEGISYEDGTGSFDVSGVELGVLQIELPDDADMQECSRHKTEVLRLWYSLVQQYSSRDLWDPADIFAALSGIAQFTERSLQTAYLAGIWESDMIRGLLWQPRNLHSASLFKSLVRPTVTNTLWGKRAGDPLVRAPSWSWAAPQGPITYGSSFVARYDAVFLDASRWRIRPADPSGRWSPKANTFHAADFDMSSCTICIVGKPKAVLCSKASPREIPSNFRRFVTRKRHVLLTVKEGPIAGDVVGIGLYDIVEEEDEEAWCLQVVDQRGVKSRHAIDGLLLRRCGEATFARVGTFRILDEVFFEELEDEEALTLI